MNQVSILDADIVALLAVGTTFLGCTASGFAIFPADAVLVEIVGFPLVTFAGSFLLARAVARRRPFQNELAYHARHLRPGRLVVVLLLILPIMLGVSAAFILHRYHDLADARFLLIASMAAAGSRLQTVLVMLDRGKFKLRR